MSKGLTTGRKNIIAKGSSEIQEENNHDLYKTIIIIITNLWVRIKY